MIAAMILALCAGVSYSWSVFQKPIMEEFDWSLEKVSFTYTLLILVSTITPLFIGKYQIKLGVKTYLRIGMAFYVAGLFLAMFTNSLAALYISFGVLTATGIAMLYPCLMAYGGRLFPENTGMAASLIAFSFGGGSIIWAPLAANIIGKQGVLPMFGLFAALFLIVMAPTGFLIKETPDVREPRRDEGRRESASKDYTWREMTRTGRYYIIVVVIALGGAAGLMVIGHASGILQELQGFTPEEAAFTLGVISIFNAFGRIVIGTLSDKVGRYPLIMAMFVAICASMLILTKAGGPVFVIALGVTSLCYGGFAALLSPLCVDNFGLKNLSVNYGFFFIAFGLAGLIGPQVASQSIKLGGGYNSAFKIVAILAVIGLVLTAYLMAEKKKREKEKILRESF